MKRLVQVLSVLTWLLVASSVVIIAGGLFGRPLLLAAVPTGSMFPVLKPGDLIVVLPTWAAPKAAPGDIIVYRTPKEQDWIVHRIIEGNAAEGFLLKGDANHSPDPNPVFPRDMAGVVPQWKGAALRLPRLGLLSGDSGPFSSPVVAGVALVMGIYLLVLDAAPRARGFRLPHLGQKRPRSSAIASLYLGLAATAFVTTLIPAWTMSSRQQVSHQVVDQRPSNMVRPRQYLTGFPHREEVVIQNPSPLPLVVVFASDDPNIRYEPWWHVVPGRGSQRFGMTIETPLAGQYESMQRMGVFLPLLPPALLASLARLNLALAALTTALVPAAVVVGMALFDPRVRLAMARLRTRMAVFRL